MSGRAALRCRCNCITAALFLRRGFGNISNRIGRVPREGAGPLRTNLREDFIIVVAPIDADKQLRTVRDSGAVCGRSPNDRLVKCVHPRMMSPAFKIQSSVFVRNTQRRDIVARSRFNSEILSILLPLGLDGWAHQAIAAAPGPRRFGACRYERLRSYFDQCLKRRKN
jgi:hypothetical protein